MLSFFSNLLGAIGHFFDYLKQKRLADAVEDKMEAENKLEVEKASHERTIENHKVELEVRDVEPVKVNRKARRIEG